MIKMLLATALLILFSSCGRGPAGESIVGPIGPKGDAGANAILEVIDPCGDAPGVIDEVLIRLTDGQVLASFSDNASGANTRFSLIPSGSYITTDGSSCHFTITATGDVL